MKKRRNQVIRKETPQGGKEPAASNKNNIALDAIFVALLLIAVLFFFKDALLGARTLIWDAADYFYPYFFTVSSNLRNADMPLWNPFLFNGFPTIANIEAQIFYPLNLLFLPFTPFTPYALHLSLILHCFIAGTFMYLLARNSIENRWACLTSAVVYMFSGFVIGHFEHVTMVEVMAWLPLVFLLLEKALLEKKVAYAIFAGFFLGISILAGHPQTSHGMIFILVVHTVYRAASISAKEGKRNVVLYAAAMLVICLGMGVLIAAAQLLPTYELVKESTRGSALAFDYAAKSAQLSLRDAILLIIPNYFGALTGPYWGDIDISQNIFYIGVVPSLLIWLALLGEKKRSDIIYFLAMAVFFLMVPLGENGPVFPLLYRYLPGFNYFRGPANTIYLYTFFAALLTGYGFNGLAGNRRKLSFFICIGIFFLFCIVLYLLSPPPPRGIAAQAAGNIHAGFQDFLGIFMLSVIIICISLYYPRFRYYCFATLLLITFADLYMHFSESKTIGVKASPQIYEKQPDVITAIKKDSGIEASDDPAIELNNSELSRGLFRIYTKPEGVQGTVNFGINRAMIFRTFLVEGFEPLEMTRHRKLIERLSTRNPDNLYKIMNVKYITTIKNNNFQLFIFPNFLPRAYIVPNARFIDNEDQILEELAGFDPLSEVVISGKGKETAGQLMYPGDWTATITRYTGNQVEIRTQSKKDGYLVLSDTFYPGWQAWVDGVEKEIRRANYDFRALSLPAGNHIVVFKFNPLSFKIGLWVSFAGVVIIGIACLYMRFSRGFVFSPLEADKS